MRRRYFAPIAADPDGTSRAVNADVAVTTRDLVPNVLPEGALTPDDRAVIVNALYLRAPWALPFAASRTEHAPFHGPGGTRAVPTMCRVDLHLPRLRVEWATELVEPLRALGVDRPFLLIVTHRPTGAAAFTARVREP